VVGVEEWRAADRTQVAGEQFSLLQRFQTQTTGVVSTAFGAAFTLPRGGSRLTSQTVDHALKNHRFTTFEHSVCGSGGQHAQCVVPEADAKSEWEKREPAVPSTPWMLFTAILFRIDTFSSIGGF